jgi:hypothetical protein
MNIIIESRKLLRLNYLTTGYLLVIFFVTALVAQNKNFPKPQIEYNPERYICYRSADPIEIDGEFDEDDWQNAVRTKYFVDIEGSLKPSPRFWTYVKMLWDDDFFYIAAEIQEPHIWATLEKRDAIVYQDNDFEVFIDPDGDTHNYYEIEINAFGAFWDLFLVRPYRDGGPAISAWDIYGMKIGVEIVGTINNTSDIDSRWRVEMAIPWNVLAEGADTASPPQDGDYWRINFSRVVWPVEIIGGKYVKFKNRETGKTVPEMNWVWSPQGLINMHYPEMWGYVYFSETIAGEGTSEFNITESDKIKWLLRQIYYEQKIYFLKHKKYTEQLSDLDEKIWSAGEGHLPVSIQSTLTLFESTIKDTTTGMTWHIRQDGLIWKSPQD